MSDAEIPKRVILVLLVLTILVSLIGTLAFLEFYTAVPQLNEKPGSSQANVRVVILAPGETASDYDSNSEATGEVGVTVPPSAPEVNEPQ